MKPRVVKEGPIIDDRPPTRTRIPAPANDARPGLPVPAPRADVRFTWPQATSAPATGIVMSPDSTNWSKPGAVKIQPAPVGKYAAPGSSPTITGGFGGNSPSGTGLPDQVKGYDPTARPGESDRRRVGRGIPKQ